MDGANKLLIFFFLIGIAVIVGVGYSSHLLPSLKEGTTDYIEEGQIYYIDSLKNGKLPAARNESCKCDYSTYPPLFYAAAAIVPQNLWGFLSISFAILTLLVIAIYSFEVKNPFVLGAAAVLPYIWNVTFNSDIMLIFLASVSLFFSHRLERTKKLKYLFLLSLFAGLALLTKYTAMLLVAAVGIFFLFKNKRYFILFALVVFLISGWWYLRNFSLYGNPFYIPLAKEFRTDWLSGTGESVLMQFAPFCAYRYLLQPETHVGISAWHPYVIASAIMLLYFLYAVVKKIRFNIIGLFVFLALALTFTGLAVYPDVAIGKYIGIASFPLAVLFSATGKREFAVFFLFMLLVIGMWFFCQANNEKELFLKFILWGRLDYLL